MKIVLTDQEIEAALETRWVRRRRPPPSLDGWIMESVPNRNGTHSYVYFRDAVGEPAIQAKVRRELYRVFEEAGRICGICNQVGGPDERTEIDHIVRRRDGGTHDLANLRVAHARCNNARR